MKKHALALASTLTLAGCVVEPPKPPATASPANATATTADAHPKPAASQATVQSSPPSDASAPTPSDVVAAAVVAAAWSSWSASGGETPNTVCKKEADQELCFDAIDNDCNGLVDEGCPGYRNTGNALQLTVAWKTPVDLDLRVIAPDGSEVSAASRESGALLLDKACSGLDGGVDDCPEGKIENVTVPADRPVPKGRYTIRVELSHGRGQKHAHVPFFLGGKIGAQTFYVAAFVPNKQGAIKTFTVDVH